jgi:hypothetical protein
MTDWDWTEDSDGDWTTARHGLVASVSPVEETGYAWSVSSTSGVLYEGEESFTARGVSPGPKGRKLLLELAKTQATRSLKSSTQDSARGHADE